jgi:hypothetical protein
LLITLTKLQHEGYDGSARSRTNSTDVGSQEAVDLHPPSWGWHSEGKQQQLLWTSLIP